MKFLEILAKIMIILEILVFIAMVFSLFMSSEINITGLTIATIIGINICSNLYTLFKASK